MPTITRLFCMLLLSLVAASCASRASEGPTIGAQGGGDVIREIVVENNVSVDIQVSAVVGPRTLQMGTVRAQSRRSIRLPSAVNTSTFRLMAEPRGNMSMANRLYSEPIPTNEANNVTWEIRSNIAVVTYGRRGAAQP